MKERPPKSAEALAEAEEKRRQGLLRQVRMMVRALKDSAVGKALALLSTGIFGVVLATAYGQILLNRWNKPFFDALSRRDFKEFLVQLGVFFLIAGMLLVLNVTQRWLQETLKLRLREGLVQDLVGHWMKPRRAFWLTHAGPMGVNPDQRMHDDTHKLCDLSADLGVGLLQASILVVSFSGVLWVISEDFSFRIADQDYAVPGFMLWAAIIYAGTGSLLSYIVGRSLIVRNAERYAREADLRFSLVRVNEHLDGISLASGEADERRRIERYLSGVLAATRRLIRGLTNLTWVTAGFGWTTTVAPILVAAPLYLSGKISFGGLMMAAAAFTQAQSSLRWFVDNFSLIADWRATLLRVASFRHVLTAGESVPEFDTRIDYVDGDVDQLRIDDLEVVSQNGRDRVSEAHVLIRQGERVVIEGDPGTGKTLLFRALTGLWPWGQGRITRPDDAQILYMPRGTPYLPSGTLREVLAYPLEVEQFDAKAYATALARLDLQRLVPSLDVARRWDRDLSHDEQMSLAFARILVHRPPWVLIDDAIAALDDETQHRVIEIFENELASVSVIHIGKAGLLQDRLFKRVLHLVKANASASPDATAGAGEGGR